MTSVTLQYLTAAKASGEDAANFLQAQLTADLTRLAENDACFAGYCNPNGNVLAVIRVIRRSDDYLLIAARDLVDSLLATLKKYVLRARVRFEPAQGTVVGIADGGLPEYALAADPAPRVLEAERERVEEWRLDEIRGGIVWLGPLTSGRFLPQMIGLDRLGGLSFRKGCFPGQEVIARVHYLGKLKRRPLILAVEEGHLELEPGSEVKLLAGDDAVGDAVMVDSAQGGDGAALFLVARNPGGMAVSGIEGGGRRLAVRELPQT